MGENLHAVTVARFLAMADRVLQGNKVLILCNFYAPLELKGKLHSVCACVLLESKSIG